MSQGDTLSEKELLESLDKTFKFIQGAISYKILLLLLFYKALSDKWLKAVEDYKKEGYTQTKAYIIANQDYYILFDEEEQKLLTWHEVMKEKETIIELANSVKRISKLNDHFAELGAFVDTLNIPLLNKSENLKNINNILDVFNSLNFSNANSDTIGLGYTYILRKFEPEKVEKGKNYTPRELAKLLVTLAEIENGAKVLDPAVGSGTILVETWKSVSQKEKPQILLLGQDIDPEMVLFAKLNLTLHGIKDYEIFIGDSLSYPRFGECDYVLANPPWNQGYNVKTLKEDPKVKKIYSIFANSTTDWAWIQLMLYFARRKVGIILDNGALFRERDRKIREEIVKKDLVETVILFPPKLFRDKKERQGCIIIFNKNKPENKKRKIILINASKEFEKHPEEKALNILTDENIKRIYNAFKEFKDVEGFCKVVSIEDIANNNFDLNVTRYVAPLEQSEEINLVKEFEEFENAERKEKELLEKALSYVKEIIRV